MNANTASIATYTKCLLLTLAVALTAGSVRPLHAQTTWTGNTSQDWSTASNWTSGLPTNGGETAIINTSTGSYPIFSSADGTFQAGWDIAVGYTGGTGRLDVTGGTLETGNGNYFVVGGDQSGGGNEPGNGALNLADTTSFGGAFTGYGEGSGSIAAGVFWVGGGAYYGLDTVDTGVANINTSGTITTTTNFQDVSVGVGFIGTGTINLDNGTIDANNEFWVGDTGTGTVNES